MKVVSMLPSATEMLYFLGAWDDVVAVSDDCDFPPAVKDKPKAMCCIIDCNKLTSREIDDAVSRLMHERGTLYTVDEPLLLQLKPDVIISQDLCAVCSITPSQFQKTMAKLAPFGTWLMSVSPTRLEDVFNNIVEIATAVGRKEKGVELVSQCRARMENVRQKVSADLPAAPDGTACLSGRQAQAGKRHPRLFSMEWLDPIYNAGHWVPEMVELAGGKPVLAEKGKPSYRLKPSALLEADPDIVVLAPCGYRPERTIREMPSVLEKPFWQKLRAFREGQVYLTDETFFAKPGPRLVDGIEILAEIMYPHLNFGQREKGGFRRLFDIPTLTQKMPVMLR